MSKFKSIRNYFITGLIVLIPVVATFYVVFAVFSTLDKIVGPLIVLIFGRRIPGVGVAVSLSLVFLAGVIGKNVLGKRLINLGEWMMNKIPMVKQIYTTMKQIMDAFFNQSTMKAFKNVVIVEYPRKGLYQLGFVTSTEGMEAVEQIVDKEVVNVFLPTTPNPTSGMLVIVPKEEVIYIDMPVEDGIKLILSGGVLVPGSKEAPILNEPKDGKKAHHHDEKKHED